MTNNDTMTDVAIIGCGPIGALAANLLGRAGLSVAVLEQETAHCPVPRAMHLDHEMMRLFQSAGVIERLAGDMADTDGHLHVGASGQVIRYMGTVGLERPFGWANDYFFFQPELEAHLRDGLAVLPHVALKLGARFVDLTQQDGSVTVTYEQDGVVQDLTAHWVIGCDGARSAVRKALGVTLDDLDFEEPWLVVDAEVEGPVHFPPIVGVPAAADLQRLSVMMCDPARPATIVPGRGNHRRWEFMLLPGEDDAAMMQPDTVAALVAPWIAHVPHRIIRATTYRFHGLVAHRWQVGQVFLAGDAAHQTPPFFGQGMCHGMRDVANLAWKMVAVARDGADPAILDTYQPERDPHVRSVIGAAVATGRYICELDLDKARARDAEMARRAAAHAASGQRETATNLIPAITAGVVAAGTPGAGERFIQPMLEDGRRLDEATGGGWRLFTPCAVTAPGVTVVALDSLADGRAVARWLEARGGQSVLVRPDHYVFGTGPVETLIAERNRMLGLVMEKAA